MATKKSTPVAPKATTKKPANVAKLPKGMMPKELKDLSGKEHKTVLVPVLSQPYAKAPAVDPYLKPGSYTIENATVCGYQLPPIMRGIQPGKGFRNEEVNYSVKVIWISRDQIETMMACVAREHPELKQMLEIMKAFMCHLDTVRDECKLGVLASLGWMREHMPEDSPAFSNLNGVIKMLGRWSDEKRLHLH